MCHKRVEQCLSLDPDTFAMRNAVLAVLAKSDWPLEAHLPARGMALFVSCKVHCFTLNKHLADRLA
jgi:hypothetical protein